MKHEYLCVFVVVVVADVVDVDDDGDI